MRALIRTLCLAWIIACWLGGCAGGTEGSQTGRFVKFFFVAQDQTGKPRQVEIVVSAAPDKQTEFLTSPDGKASGEVYVAKGSLLTIKAKDLQTNINEEFVLDTVPEEIPALSFRVTVELEQQIILLDTEVVEDPTPTSSLDPIAPGPSNNNGENNSKPKPPNAPHPTPTVAPPAPVPTATPSPPQTEAATYDLSGVILDFAGIGTTVASVEATIRSAAWSETVQLTTNANGRFEWSFELPTEVVVADLQELIISITAQSITFGPFPISSLDSTPTFKWIRNGEGTEIVYQRNTNNQPGDAVPPIEDPTSVTPSTPTPVPPRSPPSPDDITKPRTPTL